MIIRTMTVWSLLQVNDHTTALRAARRPASPEVRAGRSVTSQTPCTVPADPDTAFYCPRHCLLLSQLTQTPPSTVPAVPDTAFYCPSCPRHRLILSQLTQAPSAVPAVPDTAFYCPSCSSGCQPVVTSA